MIPVAVVKNGDLLARIHPAKRIAGAPADSRGGPDGLLAGRHFPGPARPGDRLAVVAAEA